MNEEKREDRIDPVLSAAYTELRSEPVPEVDWEAMRRAIATRAEPMLSRRRMRRVVRVARPLAPLALAASLAFGLWLAPDYVRDVLQPETVAATQDVDEILEQVLDDDVSDQELRNLVTGRADPEALLVMAVSSN